LPVNHGHAKNNTRNAYFLVLIIIFTFYCLLFVMEQDFNRLMQELREAFLPSEHKDRVIKGGGTWYYVPWQTILKRLNKVCGYQWEVSWGFPAFDHEANTCVVHCTITICGVSRQNIGDAEIIERNKDGKVVHSRGTPIDRAKAAAFKNAAEMFGICSYLDEQISDKKRFESIYTSQKPKAQANKNKPKPTKQGKPEPNEYFDNLDNNPTWLKFQADLNNAKDFAEIALISNSLDKDMDELLKLNQDVRQIANRTIIARRKEIRQAARAS
jgi:hypothetical protein